jgi:hypothetical protein
LNWSTALLEVLIVSAADSGFKVRWLMEGFLAGGRAPDAFNAEADPCHTSPRVHR